VAFLKWHPHGGINILLRDATLFFIFARELQLLFQAKIISSKA